MTELLVPMTKVQIENLRKLEKARKALKEDGESSIDLEIAEMSFRGVVPQAHIRTPGHWLLRPFIGPLRLKERRELIGVKADPKTGKPCLVYGEKDYSHRS